MLTVIYMNVIATDAMWNVFHCLSNPNNDKLFYAILELYWNVYMK